MIKRLKFYINNGFDPYINLAREKCLFDAIESDTCTLYLWQNQNTVVIGKNQNAFAECRTELLQAEGGRLARRLSGGGAVFHDLGNLNFTFLCSTDNFDVSKQLGVIAHACRLAGVEVNPSGRNDLLADGRKFSGNAFYNSAGSSYHHGTIMISADTDKMQRYLTPPKAKLEAKGVKSVRSRVVNLCELSPDLTAERMTEYLLKAFDAVYGLAAEPHPSLDEASVNELAEKYGSREYLYGTPMPFTLSVSDRFDFGQTEIQLRTVGGNVKEVKVFTDSLDTSLPESIEQALIGIAFEPQTVKKALTSALPDNVAQPLVSLFEKQIF